MSSWKENLRLPAPGVRYGERLLPQVVDESALADPNRILGMIPKSTDTSKGWYTLTTKQLSHCVNYAAWWIEGQVGRTEDIETIAYLVRSLSTSLEFDKAKLEANAFIGNKRFSLLGLRACSH